ncbi:MULTISPECIES: LysR family transcriptional regulator [Dethiosulfovibrio]|uniref:LysR family transcriptional regulator n=2 Tax=Dethiosulfovibrio TaxID=47054 RepID=A0ABS9EN04_9BACT|nr:MULTISPECIES: LysR family transcriptional regulator [Dethiosulfovibrio]MCF4114244.1 LysR family transcriptional regulator [Dethiosulfovibrio russensis]MCF4142566.1 LysR family transcriptional regulator [Dethiosulfovibrio marinus]MCF4145569.1 LysR family transcriptional regulator [Dethiosulfovibrio acidaminovorans]
MDEKDWLIVEALWKERNVTQAAKRLYMSQPAVTRRIQHMESEFGCRILIRRGRGVDLTPQGERLVDYARKSLKGLRDLKDSLDGDDYRVRGTLRIGCANIFAKYRLPDLLKSFCGKYPDVEVKVRTGHSQRVYDMLLSDEAQLIIARGDFKWPELSHQMDDDGLYYVVSSEPLDIDRLPEMPRIHNRTDGPLETDIRNWWQSRYSVPPTVSMEVDTVDICLQMVRKGLGYAILSGLCLEEATELHGEMLVFPDGNPLRRDTRLYCRENAVGLKALAAFVEFVKGEVAFKRPLAR